MRGRTPLLVVVTSVMACTSAPAGTAPAPSLPMGQCLPGDRAEEIRATVDLVESAADDEPSTDVGTPVTLRYAVTNRTKSEIVLWRCGFWPNHRLVVQGDSGAAVRALPAGEDAARAFGGARTRNVRVALAPRARDDGEAPLDLAKLYDLDRAGHYTVRVDYDDDLVVVSNTIGFWRLPRGARAVLDKLHGWPADEIDASERPASSPGRASSGETNGFLGAHKDQLRALGVDVKWEPMTRRYRVIKILAP